MDRGEPSNKNVPRLEPQRLSISFRDMSGYELELRIKATSKSGQGNGALLCPH